MKKKFLAGLAVALIMVGIASHAFALSYDANVTPAKANGDMLWGSGNANGGWTVDKTDKVEVGLRTHVRVPEPLNVFNSNHNGTYSYAAGTIDNKALWNFDFSVDLLPGSMLKFSSVIVELGYDTDSGAGKNMVFFNPLSLPDNATINYLTSFTIAQNSENFAWFGGNQNIDHATWDFVLRVSDINHQLLAETDMTVLIGGGAQAAPVPEPGTMMLLGVGMLGLAVYGKRRKSNKA